MGEAEALRPGGLTRALYRGPGGGRPGHAADPRARVGAARWPGWTSGRITAVALGLTALIVAADWLTPAGVVVGILLAFPIILASVSDEPRSVWLAFGVALLGRSLAVVFGKGPVAPPEFWLPNRVLVFLTLPASLGIGLLLQRRRFAAEAARAAAERASELNRLLLSLMAHDLRSPLATAIRTFEYVEGQLERGRPVEHELLAEVHARLRRNLATMDGVLRVARAELDAATAAGPAAAVPLAASLASEVDGFAAEAAARGKRLETDFSALGGDRYALDERVLRQAVGIVVDNAIRHALPGAVRVRADAVPDAVVVRVADEGPGLSAPGRRPSSGSGIGLQLCVALVARVGGAIDVERDGPDGTTFAVRVPARRMEG
ncbi:MAG TPA: HAMP domain-containing sensor histidine kinase [Longimicrobiales bacterium]|nr:HAMP domain-containing sensor histidine kinase [Longimicrobiales bacterium]